MCRDPPLAAGDFGTRLRMRLDPTVCTRTVRRFGIGYDSRGDVARRLVVAQAEERGVTDAAALGPLGEADLRDELGVDEVCLALGGATLERVGERGRIAGERRERDLELAEHRLGEAGTHPARVAQRTGVVVVTEEQRAERGGAGALAREPATDDELLIHQVLDLHPRRVAAPRLVDAVDPFRDDALEREPPAQFDRGPAVTELVGRHAPSPVFGYQLLEQSAAIRVGKSHGDVAVEPEEIEHDVDDGDLDGEALDLVSGLHVHASLEAPEARPALIVERDDLAVEQRLVTVERIDERSQLGVARRHLVGVAGPES